MEDDKKAAKAAAQKRWYEKNKARHKENTYKRKLEQIEIARAYIRKVKEESGCIDCKTSYPYYVLQFDHLGDKVYTIADMVQSGYSVAKLQTEIDKCEVVCANCHAIRTHSRMVR